MLRMRFQFALLISTILAFGSNLLAEKAVYSTPESAAESAEYAIQGEYSGEVESEGVIGIQIIAKGNNKFEAVAYRGGLPGDADSVEMIERSTGELSDGVVTFKGTEANAIHKSGQVDIEYEGNTLGTLGKKDRKSSTLGMAPPENAVVLFAGKESDTQNWIKGKMDGNKLLQQGTTSKEKFGDHLLHIEFRLPFKPKAKGQARGNSGLYVQGRYEIQMLDSFGLEGKHNECGGIYSIKEPDTNMCYPPLAWQTYDIDFTAAKYDDAGGVVENPRMTVRHNGVTIHDNVELPKTTTASPLKPGKDDGPIHLQNHNNPVRYRNIWVQRK